MKKLNQVHQVQYKKSFVKVQQLFFQHYTTNDS